MVTSLTTGRQVNLGAERAGSGPYRASSDTP
jgi:hypothetical protein